MNRIEKPEIDVPDGYEQLAKILADALAHAATGKGNDRHANGKPFEDQPMQIITGMVGIGFPLGQAMKKAQEAKGMVERGQTSAARSELLGAINYLAGAIMAIGGDGITEGRHSKPPFSEAAPYKEVDPNP